MSKTYQIVIQTQPQWTSHSPVLIQAGWTLRLAIRRGRETGRWGDDAGLASESELSASYHCWGDDAGLASESELSASYPPPSEQREVAEPGPRTTDSSRSTEASSSSRSRLESPLHGSTLEWRWTPGDWGAVSDWSTSLILPTMSRLVQPANCFFVCARVTLRNSEVESLATTTLIGRQCCGFVRIVSVAVALRHNTITAGW